MPISGHASYFTTTEEFIDHWTAANAALPPTEPLVISKSAIGAAQDATVTVLTGLLGDLSEQQAELADALNELEQSRQPLEARKEAMLVRMVQFNQKVRSALAGTGWPDALSDVPSQGDAPEKWRDVLTDIESVWGKINQKEALGAGKVLMLLDSYAFADFTAEAGALRQAFRDRRSMERAIVAERTQRDQFERMIYPILKVYRMEVPTRFAEDSVEMATLPRLTPSEGHTPVPVSASGAWDQALQAAKVHYGPTEETEVARYDLRGVPGPEFNTEDEIQLASNEAGAPREFTTTFGLGQPEQTVGLRVVIVLADGRESGSEPVFVTRPAA